MSRTVIAVPFGRLVSLSAISNISKKSAPHRLHKGAESDYVEVKFNSFISNNPSNTHDYDGKHNPNYNSANNHNHSARIGKLYIQ